METKTCTQCHIAQDKTNFYKRLKNPDGLYPWCKECCKIKCRDYTIKNRGKLNKAKREWYKRTNYGKKQYEKQKQDAEYVRKHRERGKKRYIRDREKILAYHKKHRKKESTKERMRKYVKNRRATDISFRLALNLRTRIHHALRGLSKKNKKTMELIGCTIDELKKHIESKFTQGMTWGNYATFWEIDHIIPCRAFDFTIPENQQKCFHYSNLQPLSNDENNRKLDRLPDGTFARHINPRINLD